MDYLYAIKMIEDGISVLFVFHHLLSRIKMLCYMSSGFRCQHVSRYFNQVAGPANCQA